MQERYIIVRLSIERLNAEPARCLNNRREGQVQPARPNAQDYTFRSRQFATATKLSHFRVAGQINPEIIEYSARFSSATKACFQVVASETQANSMILNNYPKVRHGLRQLYKIYRSVALFAARSATSEN